jgi:hypothetical protein
LERLGGFVGAKPHCELGRERERTPSFA